MVFARLYLTLPLVIAASSLVAQAEIFPTGSAVIASPLMNPDRWQRCSVEGYKSAQQVYELSCGPVTYFVPANYVVEDNANNQELLIPAAARDLLPAGTDVVASPTYLPDRWELCTVSKPLYETNGYEIVCASGIFAVSRTQVLPATEGGSVVESLERITAQGNSQAAPKPALEGSLNLQERSTSSNAILSPLEQVDYSPGQMVQASPAEGVWGEAVVIEKLGSDYRIQMLPGDGYPGAPQLILRSDQIRMAENRDEPPAPAPAPSPALSLPNGTYYCGIARGGVVFFTGEIEIRDGFFRGPAFDGKYGDWYPMETSLDGTIVWGGPLTGFEFDGSRVVSSLIKGDGGDPAFDVMLQMKSGIFLSNSCVPK